MNRNTIAVQGVVYNTQLLRKYKCYLWCYYLRQYGVKIIEIIEINAEKVGFYYKMHIEIWLYKN